MVLLGMVPVLIAAPPITSIFSTSAARLPNFVAWMAARWPAGPDPITMRSYLSMSSEAGRTASFLNRATIGAQVYHQAQQIHLGRSATSEKLPTCKNLITD